MPIAVLTQLYCNGHIATSQSQVFDQFGKHLDTYPDITKRVVTDYQTSITQRPNIKVFRRRVFKYLVEKPRQSKFKIKFILINSFILKMGDFQNSNFFRRLKLPTCMSIEMFRKVDLLGKAWSALNPRSFNSLCYFDSVASLLMLATEEKENEICGRAAYGCFTAVIHLNTFSRATGSFWQRKTLQGPTA